MRRFPKDDRGSVGLEFGIAIPVLVALIIGVLQFGLVLNANGAMRHAMGEGLRLAKVDPSASNTEVTDRVKAQLVGVDPAGIQTLTFNRATSNNIERGTMTMTVRLTPVIPFAAVPPITLTETKTIYLPN
jgi:Flp pilus assembly protein TadG